MTSADKYLIVASDGIWEFLTNKEVVEVSRKADDPQEAAQLLWKAAYKEWITKEVRTDDITVIVVDLSGSFAAGSSKGGAGAAGSSKAKAAAKATENSRRGSLGAPKK